MPTSEIATVYRADGRRYFSLQSAWKAIARRDMMRDHERISDEDYRETGERCGCEWCAYTGQLFASKPDAWRERVRELKEADA